VIYAKKKKIKFKRQKPLKTLVKIISPFAFQWITTNTIAKRIIMSIINQNTDFPNIVTIKK
jgi:hypothetical protein